MEDPSMRPEQLVEFIRQRLSHEVSQPPRGKLSGGMHWIVVFLLLILVGGTYIGMYSWGFYRGGIFISSPTGEVWQKCIRLPAEITFCLWKSGRQPGHWRRSSSRSRCSHTSVTRSYFIRCSRDRYHFAPEVCGSAPASELRESSRSCSEVTQSQSRR